VSDRWAAVVASTMGGIAMMVVALFGYRDELAQKECKASAAPAGSAVTDCRGQIEFYEAGGHHYVVCRCGKENGK
jgi:hypothetical protein